MMSGDSGLPITVPAALQTLHECPQVFLHLAGDSVGLSSAIANWPAAKQSRVSICHAPDQVHMGDQPSTFLRGVDDSSMRKALQALANGEVCAVVSAGNAGALMVLARKLVGMLQHATRPAFCSMFPTERGASLILDLGANVDCPAPQLCSFAVLGNALFSTLFPVASPRVALLSNGVEPGKGNAQVKLAAGQLEQLPGINYVGYVEANALHGGSADVVICDGFVGNIALKAIEGTAELASEKLRQLLSSGSAPAPVGEHAEQLVAAFSSAMNPELHNGAFLLGLARVVVKAHGHSSVEGFVASIKQALKCEEQNMIANMKGQLEAAAGATS
jgi:glycerol-3-phosphate acyltransferase PlsX